MAQTLSLDYSMPDALDLALNDPVLPPARIPAEAIPALLERYRAGDHLRDLAAEYGVSKQALQKRLDRWCLSGKGDVSWHDAVTDYLTDRLCTAMEEQELSAHRVDVARTRDITNNWRWVNERRRPKLYGQKQEISLDEQITVIVQRHPTPPVIDIDVRSTMQSDEKPNEINGPNV